MAVVLPTMHTALADLETLDLGDPRRLSAIIGRPAFRTYRKELEVMRGEISYDLVLHDDMEFLEGTYRLPDKDWQVFVVSAFDRAFHEVQVVPQQWQSGVTGMLLRIPISDKINAMTVEKVLSERLGVSKWARVQGPDSMQLR